MYCLRFLAPPNRGSVQVSNKWNDLKKRMFETKPNFWFEMAIQKLGDPQWRIENNITETLYTDLVLVNHTEGGIGSPDGPHIRLDMVHYLQYGLWKDIVFVFNGDGWTPELVLPYKTALEELVRAEVGYEFDCALEVGGEWAYCR